MITETSGTSAGAGSAGFSSLLRLTNLGQRYLLLPVVRVADPEAPPDAQGVAEHLNHGAIPGGGRKLIVHLDRRLDELSITLHACDHEELQVVGPPADQ